MPSRPPCSGHGPRADGAAVPLVARELQVLLWNGCPDRAAMSADWRPVA